MRKNRKGLIAGMSALTAVLLMPVFFGTGCSDKPSCKLLYKRLDKCEDDFALKEEKFIKLCKKRKDKPRVKEQIKCSKHEDCDKFKKCLKDARKKARAARAKKRIEEAVKEKKYSKALLTCKYSKDILTDGLKKKCNELADKAYKEVYDKAVKMRDKGPVEKRYRVCSDLKSAAKAIGDKKVKEAESMCKQLEAAEYGHKAIKKAKEAMKDAKRIPFNCSYGLKKVSAIKEDFAKKIKKKIIQACYVDLGAAILKKKLPTMKRYCPYNIKKIYKAVKKHGIKDPKLDPLLEKGKAVCDK